MAQSMRRLVHAAILAVVVMLFTAPVQHAFAALTAAQSAATLAFLQEFPDELKYLKNLWKGTDYCSWEGITCDATTGYVSVNLAGKGLTGDMPQLDSDIDGSQVMITSIDMSNNPAWHDDFEDSWSRLTNLQYLDLSNTSLKGDIPDKWTRMSSLQTVKISNTYACKTLPNWNIASLRTIDLSNNAFSGSLPASWGSMTGLTSVNLAGVYPCGCVPTTWTSSVLVDAAAAIGSGVSASTCATLNSCNNNHNDHCLNYNDKYAGLTVSQRHTLDFLQEFPDEIKYLKNRWTGVDYCGWEGITCDATTGDVTINLAGKGLTGDMPEMDSDVDGWHVQVVSIDMSNNPAWRDDFEEDWGRLRNLKRLNLSNTALKGDIPDEWTGMRSLEEVYITNTAACKSLPNWNIAGLRVVDFSNNNLQGSLAASWSQMTSLTSVNIAGNGFCGCVPSTWTASVLTSAVDGLAVAASDCSSSNKCTFSNLRCWTHNTPTSSPTSTASATLRFLQNFPLSLTTLSSRWTGTDYCSWEGVSCDSDGYVSVDLSGRGIEGYMPQLGNGVDGSQVLVVSLSLANNPGIVGNFRDSWAALKQLRSLDLSNTGLHGDLPDAWNGMSSLETVQISNTKACRNLPNWQISTLETVVLANNNLRGTLAASWGSMTTLKTVDLTGNDFCGCVPNSWSAVSALSNAANAVGGNLTAANCTATNVCTSDSFRCFNGVGAPLQVTLAALAALVAVLTAIAL